MKIKGGDGNRVTCPKCYSERVWKDGRRKVKRGLIQRHFCKGCGYRFSGAIIFSDSSDIEGERQVCVTGSGAKNLIVANKEKPATGEISGKNNDSIEFAWWMRKQGYRPQTIEGRISIIRTLLNRHVDLKNPESVKEYLASQDCTDGRKRNVVHAYSCYLKMTGKGWNPPKYKRIPKIPWVPQEKLIDQLIAGCPNKYGPFLQMLKETGMRPGEAWQLKWVDIDLETKQVRITPEKGSNPRILPISNSLIAMLNRLDRDNEHVFKKGLYKHFSGGFRRHRRRIAANLGSPNIDRIALKSFRHFKGTMEYHRTKDILHVKMVLGHKSLNSTLVYTHLVDFRNEEFVSKIAKNAEEACKFVEDGFEYVCNTPDELMVFRKRK